MKKNESTLAIFSHHVCPAPPSNYTLLMLLFWKNINLETLKLLEILFRTLS